MMTPFPGDLADPEDPADPADPRDPADCSKQGFYLDETPLCPPGQGPGLDPTLASPGEPIGVHLLPAEAGPMSPSRTDSLKSLELPAGGVDLEDLVGDLEKRLLLEALRRSGGVRKEAAKLLRISFRSIRYRLDKYGIDDGTIARLGGQS